MLPYTQCHGNDRKRRIHGSAGYKKSSVHNIEVIQIMSFTIRIHYGSLRVSTHSRCPILVCRGTDVHSFAEIDAFKEKGIKFPGSFQGFDQLIFKQFMAFSIVWGIGNPDLPVLFNGNPVFRIRKVF